jgi:hypothetical protein
MFLVFDGDFRCFIKEKLVKERFNLAIFATQISLTFTTLLWVEEAVDIFNQIHQKCLSIHSTTYGFKHKNSGRSWLRWSAIGAIVCHKTCSN